MLAAVVLAVGLLTFRDAPAAAAPPPPPAGGLVATPARAEIVRAAPATPYQNSSPSYEVSTGGAVWALGGAVAHGHISAAAKHTTVVGVTMTPDGGGYWLLTAVGGVYNFGDAGWYGSPRHSGVGIAAVGLVASGTGTGYWVYGRGGQVVAYGTARHLGDLSGRTIVDLVATPDSQGYWMVASNGAVSPFGTAASHGDVSGRRLLHPIVGMAATGDGLGYWLVSSGGNVFNEGDAPFDGSLARHPINQPVASVLPTSDGRGYWLVAHDGDLHPFGAARSSAPHLTAFVHTILTAGDRATEWAMAQLGKPYRWGGIGPKAFDCSGLTMKAWLAAGVSIPRIASSQYIRLRHVLIANLVDGDLVFYASSAKPASVYHVAMYLGGGHVINAPYTGQFVRTEWMGGPQLVADGSAP